MRVESFTDWALNENGDMYYRKNKHVYIKDAKKRGVKQITLTVEIYSVDGDHKEAYSSPVEMDRLDGRISTRKQLLFAEAVYKKFMQEIILAEQSGRITTKRWKKRNYELYMNGKKIFDMNESIPDLKNAGYYDILNVVEDKLHFDFIDKEIFYKVEQSEGMSCYKVYCDKDGNEI